MFNVVLHNPEIPPNTGNAMRLCANTGCTLHLIEPLGFDLEDSKLRRAGMDYRDRAVIRVHSDLEAWLQDAEPGRVFALAKSGKTSVADVHFKEGDSFLFGRESVGLPADVMERPWLTDTLHLPMRPEVRSLNLSNAVAVVVYEAWRQNGYEGSDR